jgi:3-hydroxybutyryl-CoA dehydrogenase
MEVHVVGVAGLGLLGRGIAGCLLAHGIKVIAYDLSAGKFVEARATIAAAIAELAERDLCSPSLPVAWKDSYVEAGSLSEFASCDFVIESIVESPSAKANLFEELEVILPSTVPIASNTSALPISLLQEGRKYPARFLGMHWAEPAHATRFLELIRGDKTDDAAMNIASQLATRNSRGKGTVRRSARHPRIYRQ